MVPFGILELQKNLFERVSSVLIRPKIQRNLKSTQKLCFILFIYSIVLLPIKPCKVYNFLALIIQKFIDAFQNPYNSMRSPVYICRDVYRQRHKHFPEPRHYFRDTSIRGPNSNIMPDTAWLQSIRHSCLLWLIRFCSGGQSQPVQAHCRQRLPR
jgi:hypothetical protein